MELQYNSEKRLLLHCADASHRPLVICVHGGGFISGSSDDVRCRQAADILTRAGFNCASLSYSLADENDRFAQWPRNLFDVADAVAFLHRQAGRHGYSDRFAMLGFSAGCCLSNLYIQGREQMLRELGHDAPWHQPLALVGFYGPYDFTTRQPERRSASPEINRLHSPRHWLLKNREEPPPPVLHFQGDRDTVVFPDQHQRFQSDCEERGYAFEGVIAKGFGHSFSPRDRNEEGVCIDTAPAIVRFLEQHLG